MPSKKSNNFPPHYGSIKGTFASTLEDEFEANLQNTNYLTVFKKMADNDAICGSFILVISKIFQSIEWKTTDDEQGILKKSLENVNWVQKIEEIISFLIYGHSVFEIVLKTEDDGRITWEDLLIRPQNTIESWNLDSRGKIESITQQSYGGSANTNAVAQAKTAIIPFNKCLYFSTMATPNRPQGKSIFRNAYRDWFYKTNIEKIEAIGIERDLTGLAILTPSDDVDLIDENGALTPLGSWAWNVVRKIKRNEQEGLVLPHGWTFELQGSPGQRQFDMNKVIDRFAANMAMSMLSQFLILGIINSSGSFALSKEQSDTFYRAIEGFAAIITNVVNTQFIGCPALGLLNNTKTPKLKAVGINKLNMNDLASFLGRLLKFNIIIPDDKLEEHLREYASLPVRDPSTSRIIPGITPEEKDEEVEDNDMMEDDKPTKEADDE